MYLGDDPGLSGLTYQLSAGTYLTASLRVASRAAAPMTVRAPLLFPKFSCCAKSNSLVEIITRMHRARKCALRVKSGNKSNRRTGISGCYK